MHDLQPHSSRNAAGDRRTDSSFAPAQIRTAGSADEGRVMALIVAAFAADPAARWMYPDAGYARYFPDFVKAFGGLAVACGTAHMTGDLAGAALWLPPGIHPDEEGVESLIRRSTPTHAHAALFALFEQMGSYHPVAPHWHLPLIGVHPACQRMGYGAALLGHALAAIDEQGVPAYLESSNPVNIPLYERHGFAALGVIQVADSPPITPMLRQPR